eukprot:COSAG01_NODE_3244_length_6360_cov_4.915988_6_plen_176_part_00
MKSEQEVWGGDEEGTLAGIRCTRSPTSPAPLCTQCTCARRGGQCNALAACCASGVTSDMTAESRSRAPSPFGEIIPKLIASGEPPTRPPLRCYRACDQCYVPPASIRRLPRPGCCGPTTALRTNAHKADPGVKVPTANAAGPLPAAAASSASSSLGHLKSILGSAWEFFVRHVCM